MDAQKVLRRLEGTPVRISNKEGQVFWQVTYDNDLYNDLLNVVIAVAKIPIKDINTTTYSGAYTRDAMGNLQPDPVVEYHREKI